MQQPCAACEHAVIGRLTDGRTLDFNLMWRRAVCEATLWHRPLVGPMVTFAKPDSVWCVHLMAGHARSGDAPVAAMHAGDTAILVAGGARLDLRPAALRREWGRWTGAAVDGDSAAVSR